ncbi:GTP 3',8-cyclase [Frankliniella fusca]|uniref:GTP 3',8-cyclase n=1 Tax=Frankliniella fusca TaxID=407009 RepID=A0AAE1H2K4_9NEOP|nr:GTP 3',8-cyclase [Frankliniella fusca]
MNFGRVKNCPLSGWIQQAKVSLRNTVNELDCELGADNYYVPKPPTARMGLKKRPQCIFTGYAHCKKEKCLRRYVFSVPQCPEADQQTCKVNVYVHGEVHHSQETDKSTIRFMPFMKFTVPAAWWSSHYVVGKRSLKKGWVEELTDRFKKEKPEGVYCSLSNATNQVSISRSATTKKGGPRRAPRFKAEMYCTGKPTCSRSYKFTIHELNMSDGPHTVHVAELIED